LVGVQNIRFSFDLEQFQYLISLKKLLFNLHLGLKKKKNQLLSSVLREPGKRITKQLQEKLMDQETQTKQTLKQKQQQQHNDNNDSNNNNNNMQLEQGLESRLLIVKKSQCSI